MPPPCILEKYLVQEVKTQTLSFTSALTPRIGHVDEMCSDCVPTMILWTRSFSRQLRSKQSHCHSCAISVERPGTTNNLCSRMGKARRRTRRSTRNDCEADQKQCCRDTLRVNFAEIGWDDWVMQPEWYDAHYCKGTCQGTFVNNHTHTHTHMHVFSDTHFSKD